MYARGVQIGDEEKSFTVTHRDNDVLRVVHLPFTRALAGTNGTDELCITCVEYTYAVVITITHIHSWITKNFPWANERFGLEFRVKL